MKRKRKLSAAQRAALAKGRAALAKRRASSVPAKAHRRRRKSARRRSSLLSRSGKHRPVVIVKKGRLRRPRRSTIPAKATFANPFLSEIAMIGNPRRKRRKSSRRSHRRSSRRSLILRNPLGSSLAAVTSGPREMASMEFLKEAGSVAVGFVLPNVAVGMLPIQFRDATWKVYASKVAVVSGLAAAGKAVAGNRVAKAILLGGGVSILLDAYQDFVVPALGGAAPSLKGVDAYYGEKGGGVSAYYGEQGGGVAGIDGTADLAEAFS